MPVRDAAIHQIDKKPDGTPAVLHLAAQPLPSISQAIENLVFDVNDTDNAKTGNGWGDFTPASGAFPQSA